MDKHIPLTDMELDALKEVGNIGVGNAASALSKILNRKINMDVPDTKYIPITRFTHDYGGPDQIVMSIYSPIIGDLQGESLFLFTRESALGLVDLMIGNAPGSTAIMDELSESAFKEMANIYIGSYLNAISNMMELRLLPGVPVVATDMVQAILDSILMKRSEYADTVLCSKTLINIDGHSITGHFMFFFDLDSLRSLVSKVKDLYGKHLE